MNNPTVVEQRIEQAKKEQLPVLDLSNLDLIAVPERIGELTHLKRLNLSKNNIQTLSPVIGKLKKLEYLNLWSNSLNTLPSELSNLSNLKEIDLEDNYFLEFPKILFKLSKLNVLDLEHNGISRVPDDITQLSNLQELDVSRNKLNALSSHIGKLNNLKVLNLKGNLLTQLPNSIGNLRNLLVLKVNGNPLDEALIEASQNGLNAISEYFIQQIIQDKIIAAKEDNLIKLDLTNHSINEIPEELYELDQLKILSLERNNIWEVSSKILQMKSLEVLDLSHNQLVNIPPFIKKLPNLKVFETEGNPLKGSGIFPKVEYQKHIVKKRIEDVKKTHAETLDLSHCGLTMIPKEVFQLSWLKTLILGKNYRDKDDIKHRNYITDIHSAISKLNNLQNLSVAGNALASLPSELEELKHLKSLDLSQNQFRKIPSVVYKLHFNLSTLNISNNKLQSLPKQIAQLKNLEQFDASNNSIDVVPQFIVQLKNLRTLNLAYNKIKKLADTIGAMQLLQYLDISNNNLESLPQSIGDLKYISKINLSYNKIKTIPEELQGWRLELQSLNLQNNFLKELPTAFKQLAKLEILGLGRNQFSKIPVAIFGLTKLEKLYLQNNKISEIPEELLTMKNLTYLDLKSNSLDKSLNKPVQKGLPGIKEWFFYRKAIDKIQQAKTYNQAVLDISNYGLRTIPKEVFDLEHLKVLIIGRDYAANEDTSLQNNINEIPKSIFKLQELEELYAIGNNLSQLPNDIDKLQSIRILDISDNSVRELPKSIGNLSNLEYLNLNYNQLRTLPFELANVRTLKEVHWNFNPFESPFREMTELDMRSLMYWMCNQMVEQKINHASTSNAQALDLSNCHLEELPQSLFKLSKIRKLNLSDNYLKVLPEDFGQLRSLDSLNLNNNQLSNLPIALTKLNRLKHLNLSGNPLDAIPPTVVQQGFYGIKQWITQQEINQQIEEILLSDRQNGHIAPLYKKEKMVCQVCHGTKQITGLSDYLHVRFYNHTCYGCNGSGIIGFESERIHTLVHKAQVNLKEVKDQLRHAIKQKKSFEQSIIFSHATHSDVVNNQVRRGFHGILDRYNKQLTLLVKRFEFYKDVQGRLHSLMYNQYLLYCTLDEFRKMDNLDTGLSLNFDEKAGLQKELMDEVKTLNDFVSNSNGLAIPSDFTDEVGILAEKYEAMM